jgi:hypothetical protein
MFFFLLPLTLVGIILGHFGNQEKREEAQGPGTGCGWAGVELRRQSAIVLTEESAILRMRRAEPATADGPPIP